MISDREVDKMRRFVIFVLFAIISHHLTSGRSIDKDGRNRGREVIKTDALILGAGMAGMSAAKQLHHAGVKDFIILEGTNRIGGRVKKQEFGGATVELGANWVHGCNDEHPLCKMAKKHNMKGAFSHFEDISVRGEKGEDLTSRGKKLYNKLDEIYVEAEELGLKLKKEKRPDISIRAALRMLGWRPKDSLEEVIEYSFYDWEYAEKPENTPLKQMFLWTYWDFGEEDFMIADPRGYEYIIHEIGKSFLKPKDRRLRLKQVVTKIAHSDKKVKVFTSDKKVYMAKYALITFSVGVLQSGTVQFKPSLPEWKEDVINQMSMTLYTKIFIRFAPDVKPFWDDTEVIHYASKTKGRGYYPVWQNMNHVIKGSNMLLATVTGAEAKRISKLSKKVVMAELAQVLKDMYGKKAHAPAEIIVPDWPTNSFAFGAFPCTSLGITPEIYAALPAPVGRLHFAGDAMKERYVGFLHGAMFSGQDEARKIASLLQSKTPTRLFTPPYLRKGCTYKNATNYRESALHDDGSCLFTAACA